MLIYDEDSVCFPVTFLNDMTYDNDNDLSK